MSLEFLRPKKSALSFDMAPMIDIVFQLLIFFMLSTSFLNPALKLTLPKAAQADARESEQIVVSLDANGSVFVNTQKTSLFNLQNELERQFRGGAKKSVHIRGDAEMPYRLFVEVMDLVRRAGAEQINIVHETQRGSS